MVKSVRHERETQHEEEKEVFTLHETIHVGHKVCIPLNFTKVTGKNSPEFPGVVSVEDETVCEAMLNYNNTALLVKALSLGKTNVSYHYNHSGKEIRGLLVMSVEEEEHQLFDMDHAVYSAA